MAIRKPLEINIIPNWISSNVSRVSLVHPYCENANDRMGAVIGFRNYEISGER
jgi:hypothetical protein